ncbi:MAG: hypothetical protein A2407_02640 [Candidatus Moranbacteria bacterium RIFOXYC1_FULL_44_8]|nr:MAG: hypothetical protein A2407_02640 [Candidatus Moranbacteria bacterium RIFOXYC1_FULL_44_8]
MRVGILQIGLILAALYIVANFNYLLFHVLAEFFGAAISLAIFLLTWNARKFVKNNYYLFFGMAFLASGMISLIHALTYRGMGIVAGTAADSNIATQLWLANQYILAVTFLIAPFLLEKKMRPQTIILGYLAFFALFLVMIFYWKIFPVAYLEGTGLTPFKKISEYVVAAVYIFSLYFFWRQRNRLEKRVLQLISFTLALFFVSTIFFTLYVGVYSFPNELGHLLRVLAFYVSYLALVEFGLMRPYHSMFKELNEKGKVLKKAKEEWERTFDSVPDLIAILDTKHGIKRVNKAMAERLGTNPEKCIGLSCFSCVHSCDKPIDACPHTLTMKDGKEHVSEIEENGLGGTFLVSTTPLFEDGGKLIGSVHVARDITERKKAEKKMEDLARFPLENPNPVIRVSSEGKILFKNPAADAVLKRFRESEKDILPEEWNKHFEPAIRAGLKKSFEIDLEKNSFFVLIAPISGADYANIYFTDITKRKEAEVALGHEKERLAQILDKMEDGVYIVDRNHNISYINPALKKHFGKNIERRKCFEYLHNRKSPCPWCMNEEVFSGKSVRWECYFENLKKTFDIIETPMTTPEGTLIKLQIMRDITERKMLEKNKDDFISLASHQLRTPLSSISLSSELLLRGTSGDIQSDQREYLEEIHKATKRMTILVNNLLNVSRIEMGTFSVESEPLDILSSVQAKLKEFEPIILEKKLYFKKNIGENIPPLSFNTNSFEIVFDNLLSNAIRYTPTGGKIALAIENKRDSVFIEISDTGCGIAAGLKDKIFEKTYRAENAREMSSEGAGLGLYMVKSIADLTGSKVWFDSNEMGGTTFYFSIPIGQELRQA